MWRPATGESQALFLSSIHTFTTLRVTTSNVNIEYHLAEPTKINLRPLNQVMTFSATTQLRSQLK